jgi:hypothetical protein
VLRDAWVWVLWDTDSERPLKGASTHTAGCYVVDPNRAGPNHEFRKIAVQGLPFDVDWCKICGGGRPAAQSVVRRLSRESTEAGSDEPLAADVVAPGRPFRVRNERAKKESSYVIVGKGNPPPNGGTAITASSPLGQAFLGHTPGDLVVAKTPAGEKHFTVLEVSG